MRKSHWLMGVALLGLIPAAAESMCGYFSRPRVVDIDQPPVLQPSQIAFITWDPESKVETVTVQPRFEGNARDFGRGIPTPSQPKRHEMPRASSKAPEGHTPPTPRAIPHLSSFPH